MSHQSTLPSVDTDMHSVPVLDCSQAKSYTGSLQRRSPGEIPARHTDRTDTGCCNPVQG